jgi:hypothetical protein
MSADRSTAPTTVPTYQRSSPREDGRQAVRTRGLALVLTLTLALPAALSLVTAVAFGPARVAHQTVIWSIRLPHLRRFETEGAAARAAIDAMDEPIASFGPAALAPLADGKRP